MFKTFSRWFGAENQTEIQAAAQVPAVAEPKVKRGWKVWPAFFRSTRPSQADIARPDRRLANTDVTSFRSRATTTEQLQLFASASPELSNALWTSNRLGIPEKFTVLVRNMDGSINPEGTKFVQALVARFDYLYDPVEGYTGFSGLKTISESLARDLMMTGQMSAELVLDKALFPSRIQPFASSSVLFREQNGKFRPYQKVGDTEVDLNIPTVVLLQVDNDLLTPYANAPLEPAVRAVIFSETFMNDLTRVVRRATYPRVKVKIDEEKFRKNLSPEAQMDPEKAREEMNEMVSQVDAMINGLQPEDAMVYFDSIGVETETPKGMNQEYETLRDISNGRLASSAKSPTSVLGLESGSASSNIASTEVAIYLRSVDSAIRQSLNQMYSRLFTMAVRLAGIDGYAVFEYEAINIRPTTELVAFRQTEQMMILEQLSLGLITDEEACLKLTGNLPPAGYVPKSGTMFHKSGAAPVTDTTSNNGSTLNQKLNSDAPAQGRGANNKKSS